MKGYVINLGTIPDPFDEKECLPVRRIGIPDKGIQIKQIGRHISIEPLTFIDRSGDKVDVDTLFQQAQNTRFQLAALYLHLDSLDTVPA